MNWTGAQEVWMLISSLPLTTWATSAMPSGSFFAGTNPHLIEPYTTYPCCSLCDMDAPIKEVNGSSLDGQNLKDQTSAISP